MQTARTKAKILENLELLMEFLLKKYGGMPDEETRTVLFNALDWTADDVQKQAGADKGDGNGH